MEPESKDEADRLCNFLSACMHCVLWAGVQEVEGGGGGGGGEGGQHAGHCQHEKVSEHGMAAGRRVAICLHLLWHVLPH